MEKLNFNLFKPKKERMPWEDKNEEVIVVHDDD